MALVFFIVVFVVAFFCGRRFERWLQGRPRKRTKEELRAEIIRFRSETSSTAAISSAPEVQASPAPKWNGVERRSRPVPAPVDGRTTVSGSYQRVRRPTSESGGASAVVDIYDDDYVVEDPPSPLPPGFTSVRGEWTPAEGSPAVPSEEGSDG